MSPPFITLKDDAQPALVFSGQWLVENLSLFEGLKAKLPKDGRILIDCKGIEEIDTASMLFFIAMRKALKSGLKVSVNGLLLF